ncbi:MAG TPA: hypothetical protein VF006_29295 [Longimicrobium sp.]
MTADTAHLAHILETDAGVGAEYRHVPKHVTPGEPLAAPGVLLKWYAVHPAGRPVPDEVTRLARSHLGANPREARGLGFVVLHRCGSDFYFLIVCTWRNDNELWQTVLYRDGEGMADFALFPRDAAHKPTLCVWELVPVQHEQRAWTRFLTSPRHRAAAEAWMADRCAGPA